MNRIAQAGHAARESRSRCPDHSRQNAANGLDANAIAVLRDQDIKAMAMNELIDVIRAGEGLLPCSNSDERLRLKDRRCLIRLAFLARKSMRNRLHGAV